MARDIPLGILSTEYDPAFLRRAMLIPAPIFPFWRFFAPASANDPWVVWWAIGGIFALAAVLPSHVSFLKRHMQVLFYACGWLVTLHFFVLASTNDMHFFYAVASFVVVVVNAALMRSRQALLTYSAFVVALAGLLYALEPGDEKAIWIPLLIVLGFDYYWLGTQLSAADLVRSYQADLEENVRIRTRELEDANVALKRTLEERDEFENQLRFSQKMEAVGRLAGGVAHDFNNLMTAIQGYGDLVLDALPEDHPAREDIKEMEAAAERAAQLTRQLLTFSREGVTETTLVDVNDTVRGLLPMLRTLLGEDNEIEVDLRPEVVRIRANRVQVEQVVLNLALNARDAMPSGGVFTLATRLVDRGDSEGAGLPAELPPGSYVLLSATDTGFGMDEATRERVFEPFFTTKDVDRGTGMGLATVYGVVSQGGGTIRLVSAVGKGSRLDLYWPVAEDLDEEIAAPPPRDSVPGGKECILLVEDEDALRRLSQRVLESNGYTVFAASDAETALELMEDVGDRIALVVTDVVMPKMSGFDLASRIAESRPSTKVLFMTGYTEHPSLRSRPLPPDVRILAKPFAPSDLTGEVRAVLDAG